MTESNVQGYFSVSKPSWKQIFWRKLGFGSQFNEDLFKWRNQKPEEGDWFSEDILTINTTVQVGWLDRLRILISGKCLLTAYIRTDTVVAHAATRSQFSVLSPGK